MPEFRTISTEEWQQYPTKQHAGKPDEWADVMAALQAGEIVELQAGDDKQLRGYRIGLGRRAKAVGLQLEYRNKDNTLAVQRRSSTNGQSTDEELQEPTASLSQEDLDVTEAESPTPSHPAPQRRGRRSAATS